MQALRAAALLLRGSLGALPPPVRGHHPLIGS